MKRRMKASDVFRNSPDPLFGKKVSFQEAFPQIDKINVDVKRVRYADEEIIYWGGGEYVDCDYELCYNGGFRIEKIIRLMVDNKETKKEGSCFCQGYEGSPKGRRRSRSCMNLFKYKIHIDYKNSKISTS